MAEREGTRLVRGERVHFVLGLGRRVHQGRDISDDLARLERATERLFVLGIVVGAERFERSTS